MCYSGSVYCACCGREYDNPGADYVAGCGCTSTKCDDCIKHGCRFSASKETPMRQMGACTG